MITVRRIQEEVCRQFNFTMDDLLQPNRKRKYARPRQIAMFLARELTGQSWGELGYDFCRDHTTVLHASRIRGKIEDDPIWGMAVGAIRYKLGSPEPLSREQFEKHMRKAWKASIPFHLTPEGAPRERFI